MNFFNSDEVHPLTDEQIKFLALHEKMHLEFSKLLLLSNTEDYLLNLAEEFHKGYDSPNLLNSNNITPAGRKYLVRLDLIANLLPFYKG